MLSDPQRAIELASTVAARSFIQRCVIPIISDHMGQHAVYGCGVLFRRGGDHFFVTATHVLNEVPVGSLGIPIGDGSSEVWTVSASLKGQTSEDREDIGVLYLEPSEWLDRIIQANGHFILSDENVHAGALPGSFACLGYPSIDVQERKDKLHGKPTLVCTTRYEGELPKVENVTLGWYDVLLKWKRDDDLRGISGCPIWAISSGNDGPWTPEKCLRLVAVQKGVVENTWIRGTSWQVVDQIINNLSSEIAGKRHRRIAEVAYFLWEARGRLDGRDLEDWYGAEREVASQVRSRLR